MIQVNDIVDGYKILSIDRTKRIFNKDGSSKGWEKQYKISCPKDHIFTRSSSFINHVERKTKTLNCPCCNKIENQKIKDSRRKDFLQQRQARIEKKLLVNNRPDLEKYFLYKEDFLNHVVGSRQKVDMVCPYCKQIKKMEISNLVHFGFSCDFCSENKSIGERFFSEVLRCNGIKFIFDKTFEWSDRKRYDFYLPDFNMIIETHGAQHYNGAFEHIGGRNLDEEIENDTYKYKMAKVHGIDKYVILDFRNSDFDFMLNSIANNQLLKDILKESTDYVLCFEKALCMKSNFKRTIEIFNDLYNQNNNPENFYLYVKDICKTLGITKTTVRNYLRKGTEVGLCQYDGSASIKSYKRFNQRRVYCKEIDTTFESIGKCAEYFNTTTGTIRYYIDGKSKKRSKYKKEYTFIAV